MADGHGPVRWGAATRGAALAVLASLAPLALDGCVSIGISRAPLPARGAEGAVHVSVFERPKDRNAARPLTTPILSQLLRLEGKGARPVARSMASTWSLPSVPAGRYRLEMTRRIDEAGDVVALGSPVEKEFDVRPGETATVNVVLRKVPVFWIVLAAVTIVVLVILSIDLLKDSDIPVPPLPPLPPGDVVVALDASLDVAAPAADSRRAPGVADSFPAPGSVVAARRVSVTFLLTAPLAPDGVHEGAVLALGSSSGEVPGTAAYDASDQLLRFTPSRDFTPGETVTVTVDLERLEGADGKDGSGRFSTRFSVARAD